MEAQNSVKEAGTEQEEMDKSVGKIPMYLYEISWLRLIFSIMYFVILRADCEQKGLTCTLPWI